MACQSVVPLIRRAACTDCTAASSWNRPIRPRLLACCNSRSASSIAAASGRTRPPLDAVSWESNLRYIWRMSDLHPSLQAGIDEFANWWHRQQTAADISQKVRRPLYHYTDAAGLKGIVENQEVWFTSLFHLNDPSELRHGVDCAVEELRGRRAVALQQGDDFTQTVCDEIERLVTHDPRSDLGFFVASFSRASDDLGQWRGYGDDGRGFAVGFAPRLFHISETVDPTKPEHNVFVAPVTY